MHITRLLVAERSIAPKRMPVRESFLFKNICGGLSQTYGTSSTFLCTCSVHKSIVLNVFELFELYCFFATMKSWGDQETGRAPAGRDQGCQWPDHEPWLRVSTPCIFGITINLNLSISVTFIVHHNIVQVPMCVYELLPQLCHHKHGHWSVIVRHIYHSANSPWLVLRTEFFCGYWLSGIPDYSRINCAVLCCLGIDGDWNFVLHSELCLKEILITIIIPAVCGFGLWSWNPRLQSYLFVCTYIFW